MLRIRGLGLGLALTVAALGAAPAAAAEDAQKAALKRCSEENFADDRKSCECIVNAAGKADKQLVGKLLKNDPNALTIKDKEKMSPIYTKCLKMPK